MKKTRIILVLLTALLVFGCGRYYRGGALFAAPPSPASSVMLASFDDSESIAGVTRQRQGSFYTSYISESTIPNLAERRLVRSAFISIRVENLDTAAAFISDLLSRYSAYIASSTIQENSHFYAFRVPAFHYDVFLAEMSGMGRLIQRTESTEDVTLRYFDLESRLETQRELLRTFQSYLGRANNIEEILSVEARIADLQREIEFVGTQLRNLSNRVEYSTIDLSLLGPVATTLNRGVTFGERVRQLVGNFGGFLSAVAVILLGILIYGIPSLLVLSLLFWILFGRIGLLRKLWHMVMNR